MKRFSGWLLSLAASFIACVSAHAQGTVSIGGEINLAVIRYDTSGPSKPDVDTIRLDSYTTRLAIKGKEDLGAGVSTDFLLGTGFRADQNAAFKGLCNRECWIRLKGPYGAVRVGRTLPIYDDISYSWYFIESPGIHNPLSLWANCGNGAGLTDGCFDVYQSGSIRYDSPTVAGFTGSFSYSMPTSELPARRNGRVYVAGGTYVNGPLYVGVAHQVDHHIRDGALVDHATTIAASYDGPLYVGGGFEHLVYQAPLDKRLSRDYVGGIVKFQEGRQTWWANYGVAFSGKGTAPADYSVVAVRALPHSGARMWTLGYRYELSRRTYLSVFYNELANQSNGVYSFDPLLTPYEGVGGRMSGLALGFQKRF